MIETAKLIPSKDVREYMEKQGRVLSDFEKATLIYNHSGMSHAEIRECLKELMDITQDADLKEEIQDRLSFDELCLRRFYENSAGYVFELYVYDSEERKTREYGCYKTGEEAVECGKKRNENFTIYKVPDGSGDEEDDCYLECKATVCFDKQGVIQGFYSREAEWTAKKPENDRERFENAYVEIPHPFSNGDFVRAKYNDRLGDEVGIVECNREDDITEQTHTYRDYSDDSLRVAYVYASARFGHEHVRIVDLEYATPDEEDEKKEILYCAQNLILGKGGLSDLQFLCDEYRGKKQEAKRKVKSLRKIRAILLGVFYGSVFLMQMVGWTIVNHMGDFEIPIWGVIATAALMTLLTCSAYLLLRGLYQKVRGIEETTFEEDMYEMFRTNG